MSEVKSIGNTIVIDFKTKEEGFEKLIEILEKMLEVQFVSEHAKLVFEDYINIQKLLYHLGVTYDEMAEFLKTYKRQKSYNEMFDRYDKL